METWIPRTLRDDGMIEMNESPSYHQCVHQYVRLGDHQAALAEKEREIARLRDTRDQMATQITQYAQENTQLQDDLDQVKADKGNAYHERNKVVAALAKCFPSGIAKTAIEGWSDDWHGCVYIDLPTGQVSWHYHDSQAYLFADLPAYTKGWDGHTTEEKYARVAALPIIDLDQMLGEAVKFALGITDSTDNYAELWKAAYQFLHSPLVQSWQARQQEGKG